MECENCGGTGWIVQTVQDVEAVEPCPECRLKTRQQQLLERAQIPPRYLDKTLDSYHPLDAKTQQLAAQKAVHYIESFPRVPRGLLLSGPCGVGKTHLSVAILKALIQEKLIHGRFVDETELLRRLQYTYGPDSPDTEQEVLRPLMQADLLVWDDLGTGRATEWVKETVSMVINHRYTFNRQTILSTNRRLDNGPDRGGHREQSLQERIGRRLFSRIMEMCEIVTLKGPDFRMDVHKAGKDFQAEKEKVRAPRSLLRCPKCHSTRIKILDEADHNEYTDLACTCEGCSEQFTSRFFKKTARLQHLSLDEV